MSPRFASVRSVWLPLVLACLAATARSSAQGNWKLQVLYEGTVGGVVTQSGTTAYVTNTINDIPVSNGPFLLSPVTNSPSQTTSGGITAKLNLYMNAHTAWNSSAASGQNGVTNGNVVFRFTWQPNGGLERDPPPHKIRFFYKRKLWARVDADADQLQGSTGSASASITVGNLTHTTRSLSVPPPAMDMDEPPITQDSDIIEADATPDASGVAEYRLPFNWSCSTNAMSPD